MQSSSTRAGGAQVASRPGTSRPGLKWKTHLTVTGWMFALPFVLVFAVFTVIPVVASLGMSFTDIRATDIRTPFNVNVVGFDNYVALFTTPDFLRALLNTAYYAGVGIPATLAVGLGLALVLNYGINRLKGFFRAAYYLPVVTNLVAVAVVWRYMLLPEGMMDELLGFVGIDAPNWLYDGVWAMPSVIGLGVWRNFGTAMVIFLAGLQTLPADVFEAASLDGAGRVRTFWSLTLPLLMPTTLLATVLMSVNFFQVFEEPFVLTSGGPLNSTLTIGYYTYNQFGFGNYDMASASSYVMLAIVALASLVQFRMLRSRS
jgi:multiple sugar transport system permease protein